MDIDSIIDECDESSAEFRVIDFSTADRDNTITFKSKHVLIG